MPSFVFLIGDVIDSFNPSEMNPAKMLKDIKRFSIIFTCVGVAIWVLAYLYFSCLLRSSSRIVKRIRVAYLQAILIQDSAWYDTTNPQELASRVSSECLAIEKALGEKFGTILLSISMSVSGLAFAFTKGWSYSLAVLAVMPFMTITTGLLAKVI